MHRVVEREHRRLTIIQVHTSPPSHPLYLIAAAPIRPDAILPDSYDLDPRGRLRRTYPRDDDHYVADMDRFELALNEMADLALELEQGE